MTVKRMARAETYLIENISNQIPRAHDTNFIDEAWEEFALGWNFEDDPSLSLAYAPLFVPWFLYCWAPHRSRSIDIPKDEAKKSMARVFLENHHSKLDRFTRRYLESALNAHFTFFRVEHAEKGVGVHFYDLVLHRPIFLDMPFVELNVPVGVIFFLRPVEVDGCRSINGVGPTGLRPLCLWKLAEKLEVERRWNIGKVANRQDLLREIYFKLENQHAESGVRHLMNLLLSSHTGYTAEQWTRFLDRPATWLAGKTLRQAARNPRQRRLVSAFFDELDILAENADIRSVLKDTARIRSMLGLNFP